MLLSSGSKFIDDYNRKLLAWKKEDIALPSAGKRRRLMAEWMPSHPKTRSNERRTPVLKDTRNAFVALVERGHGVAEIELGIVFFAGVKDHPEREGHVGFRRPTPSPSAW